MQKPTHLFKLALALPISFLLADAVVAYPCDSVGGEAYNHHGSTVQVSSDANSFGVQWSPASYAVGNGFIGVAIGTVNGEQAQSAISRRLFGPALRVQGVQVVGLLQDGPAQRASRQGNPFPQLQSRQRDGVQYIRYEWPALQPTSAFEVPLLPDSLTVWADPHGLVQALLGVCRWGIRTLRYGSMALHPYPTAEEEGRLCLGWNLEGRCHVPIQTEGCAVWRVSERLLREMGGQLELCESGPYRVGIKVTLRLAH